VQSVRIIIRRLWWACVFISTVGGAASAQDILLVSGAITTSVDGLPVPGAVVAIVGAETRVASDASGFYLLRVPSVLFDRIERRRIECGQPNDNARLGADWRHGHIGANINADRAGVLRRTHLVTLTRGLSEKQRSAR
jgi:hypothetical protein